MKEAAKPTYLAPLLCDSHQLAREAAKRRKLFNEKTLSADEIAEHEALGWIVDRKLIKKTRLKKQKLVDERLENRCWMLLFKLGYPEMNQGRNFSVLIERKGADPIRKQIDVFAKDDETVVVIECKACEKMSKRSLQKDIEEFANLKGPIARSVHGHYGARFKPKIIWLRHRSRA